MIYGRNNQGSSSSGLTVGTTTITGGAAGQILFDSGGLLQENANLLFDSASGTLQIPAQGVTAGILVGGDARLYRDSANVLRTPGAAIVDGTITAAAHIPSGAAVPTNGMYLPGANILGFATSSVATAAFDASHRFIVSSISTARASGNGVNAFIEANGNSVDAASLSLSCYTAAATGPTMNGNKSRTSTQGGQVVVQAGDVLLSVASSGSDGSVFRPAGNISYECDGTAGASDMPGRIRFLTTPDAQTTPTEAFRIDNTQLTIFQTDRSHRFNNQTSSAAGNLGTLTNAPAAGDPGFWLKINIGGTNYAIPCWLG